MCRVRAGGNVNLFVSGGRGRGEGEKMLGGGEAVRGDVNTGLAGEESIEGEEMWKGREEEGEKREITHIPIPFFTSVLPTHIN